MRNVLVLSGIFLVGIFVFCGCEDKQAQEEMAQMATELTQVKNKLASAMEENQTLSGTIEDMKAKIADSEMVKQAKEKLESQISMLNEQKDAMAKQLGDAQKMIENLKGQMASLKDANSKLQKMIEDLKSGAGDVPAVPSLPVTP